MKYFIIHAADNALNVLFDHNVVYVQGDVKKELHESVPGAVRL